MLTVVVLVVVYYNLPLDRDFDATASVTLLLAGLGALTGLFVWQVRSILRSSYPALRAVDAASSAPFRSSCCSSPGPTS